MNIKERFMSKVNVIDSGCWEWEGTVHKKNGAMFFVDGKPRPAHRMSYAIFKGDVKPCDRVRRTCGNITCVNPNHLETNK